MCCSMMLLPGPRGWWECWPCAVKACCAIDACHEGSYKGQSAGLLMPCDGAATGLLRLWPHESGLPGASHSPVHVLIVQET